MSILEFYELNKTLCRITLLSFLLILSSLSLYHKTSIAQKDDNERISVGCVSGL